MPKLRVVMEELLVEEHSISQEVKAVTVTLMVQKTMAVPEVGLQEQMEMEETLLQQTREVPTHQMQLV